MIKEATSCFVCLTTSEEDKGHFFQFRIWLHETRIKEAASCFVSGYMRRGERRLLLVCFFFFDIKVACESYRRYMRPLNITNLL